MIFWIIAAFLTFVVTALVLLPVFRKESSVESATAYDREIYRARLSEIDNDLDIGRITAEEAEAARAEEGRRLIQASKTEQAHDAQNKASAPKLMTMGMVLAIPALTLLVYLSSGSPEVPDQPLASRETGNPQNLALETLLQRAEAQLAKNPDDGRGWDVVAPVYMRLGRFEEAIVAFKNSIRVNGANQERVTSLAEAIVINAQGIVNAEARELFEQAATNNPKDPKPKFFLAIALGQEGKAEEAVSAWRDLLKDAPSDANWVPVATAQLNSQLAALGQPPEKAADKGEPGGPTQQDVENAGQMSAEDRKAMIEGMVEGLAQKMEEDPTNEAGWRRLIRSYMVLKRPDDAIKSIETARKAIPDNEAFQAHLDELEQSLKNSDVEQN